MQKISFNMKNISIFIKCILYFKPLFLVVYFYKLLGLPVKDCVIFKILVLTFKVLNHLSSTYMKELTLMVAIQSDV